MNEYESDKASPNDTIHTTTPLESSRKEECAELAARDGYQQDNVHKEVIHGITQLQDGLDSTSGTDVFHNSE